jgi:hypothetical protein
MADQPRSKIIEENPIGNGLDAFRTTFRSICEASNIPCSADALERFERQSEKDVPSTLQYAHLTIIQISRTSSLSFS